MGENFHLFIAYLNYWLLKEDQYSQHSPFVFSFYRDLLQFLKTNKSGDPQIEKFRAQLLGDQTQIPVLDLGAGSKKVPSPHREIRKITKYSTSSPKYAQIFQFFCALTPAQFVLELGTCMGISARYLAKSTKGILYSFEGSPEIQKVAKRGPTSDRINFILGPIEQELPKILDSLSTVDFALIDATHTYEATKSYFDLLVKKVHPKSIVIIGDIHWSKGMEKAWGEIRLDSRVRLTLDLFECGVVFFDSPSKKSALILDC